MPNYKQNKILSKEEKVTLKTQQKQHHEALAPKRKSKPVGVTESE